MGDRLAERLVRAARGFLGTPGKIGGRSHRGVDCPGLVIAAARDAGAVPFRWDCRDYRAAIESPADPRSKTWVWPHGDWVDGDQVQEGDVAVISLRYRPGLPYHIGIVARDEKGELTLIHYSPRGACRVVEQPLAEMSLGRDLRGFRFRPDWLQAAA